MQQNNHVRNYRWLITITVMLAAMLESLDMTVTNVALPNLMAVFDVSSNSVSWVVTAYVTASAIVMPIVGRLVSKLGRKRLLLVCVMGFGIFSFLCGFVDHFSQIVVFRIFQGLFGAALVPLSQCIVMDTFPKEDCNMGLGVWAGGVILAPILGPMVGGYILSVLNWRWIFFLNIPVCIAVMIMGYFFISETKREYTKIDWLGFSLLVLSVGSLQLLIDRGTNLHWFASRLVTYGTIMMVVTGFWFIFRGIKLKQKNIIDFTIFKTRNFTVATIITILFNASFMGASVILPIFLQNFLNYSPFQSGILNLPSGFSWLLGTAVGALLIKKVNSKLLLITGLAISIFPSLLLCQLTLTFNIDWIMWMYSIRNFGFGIFFILVITLSMLNVPAELYALSAGVYNFARNIGGSIGISYASSHLNSYMQQSWNHLGGYISNYHTGLKFWLVDQQVMPNMKTESPAAVGLYAKILADQSYLQGFNSVFLSLITLFILIFLMVFLFKKVKITKLSVRH